MVKKCIDCMSCLKDPNHPRVSCARGMWSMPYIDYEWIKRFQYLPLDPASGESLAVVCPMFEGDD